MITQELIPNGKTIDVTEENKAEYVDLMVEWISHKKIQAQMAQVTIGFNEIIPDHISIIFSPDDIKKMLIGKEDICVSEVRATAQYREGDYAETSPQVEWFWNVLEEFSETDRCAVRAHRSL